MGARASQPPCLLPCLIPPSPCEAAPRGSPSAQDDAQLLSLAFCCPAFQFHPPQIPTSLLSAFPKMPFRAPFHLVLAMNIRSCFPGVGV